MDIPSVRSESVTRPAWRHHGLLIAIVLIYTSISLTMSYVFGNGAGTDKVASLFSNFLEMLPIMVYLTLLGRFLYATYVVKPANRLDWMKADVRAFVTDWANLRTGAMTFLLMALVLVSFAQLKRLIPILHPFSMDSVFMQIDRALHFGYQPYEIVHAVFGYDMAITFFTGAYNHWLFLMYFVLIGACFLRGAPRARMQYLIAFILTWAIGGNLTATLLSSAGPVYYARLGLGDAYAPLLATLEAHAATGALSVIPLHEILWTLYTNPDSVSGIAAMPSMHVGSTVLMAIFFSQFGRWPAIAGWTFAAIIMIGSVLLAWHYAIDGYLGALIAVACWKVAGSLISSRLGPFPRQQA